MLKTKKSSGYREYKLEFAGVTYIIYKDVDGWVAVTTQGKLVTESDTKSDLLLKLEDILVFGWA